MQTVRLLFGGVIVLIASIGAMAQSVQTDYDRSFDLTKLKTYEFYQQASRPGDPLAASPINDRRIHDALDTQLRSRGFVRNSSARPDFMIAYTVATQKGLDIRDNRWGLRPRMGNIDVNQVTQGTIVVIFVDTTTRQEVWRGFVSGQIKPKDLDKDINKGIGKLVEKFVKNQTGKS